MGREERLGIGRDQGQVPRALQVEVEPGGEEPTDKRALADWRGPKTSTAGKVRSRRRSAVAARRWTYFIPRRL
jgi:hypothetical protein